jgi:hypothetical protein
VLVVVGAVPAKLHPRTVPAILESGCDVDVQVFDVSGSDEQYYEVLRDVWNIGESFITIEHDIEVSSDMLARLFLCSHLWCAHSYRIYWGDLMSTYPGSAGLGCARFDRRLIAKYPNLFDDDIPSSTYDNGRDGRFWMNLDGALSHWLKGPYRETVHRHKPDVTHHHGYDYEGAWVPDAIRARLPEGHPLAQPHAEPIRSTP